MSIDKQKLAACVAFEAFFTDLDSWRHRSGILGITSEMTSREYDDVLKGTDADVFIPLWASAGKGQDHPLLDETTLKVISEYKANGYVPQNMDGNPPDYLGNQFAYLTYLRRCSDEESAQRFEELFTLDTVKVFRNAVKETQRSHEAMLVADLMADYLAGLPLPVCPDTVLEEFPPMEKLPPVPLEPKHIVYSAGLNNCGGKCKINITVQEGCALQITTDDSSNDPQIRACLRGRGYRRTYLSPKRLRYPMRRIGERGEGKFERISWEEAAKEIASKSKETAPESRYFIYGTGNCAVLRADRMLKRILNMDGGFLGAYNTYSNACCIYVQPYIYGDSQGGISQPDIVNSSLIILWGHNPTETIFGSHLNKYLTQAKLKGIPIIVIDPRMSDTAMALADEWIPIRPSTDGALCDAMAYEMVIRDLHDIDFIHTYSIGFDEQTLPEGAPSGSSYLDYLLGKPDGIPKTAQWASRITGIPAEKIEELAIRYATTKPAALIPGYSIQRHHNGEQQTRGIAALAVMTGNVGKSGGSAGVPGHTYPRPRIDFPQGKDVFPGSIPTFLWSKAIEKGTSFTEREDGLKGVKKLESNIKQLFVIASNTLINQHSDINDTIRILKDTSKCEQIVVSDVFMTPSARFADILLPAASLLENDNIVMGWARDDYVLSNSKAVEPLFGCAPDYEWTKLVAREMGLEESFKAGHETSWDWLTDLYAELRSKEPELPDYQTFRAEGGHQFQDAPLRIAYKDNIEKHLPFKTPSGKIELFSMRLYKMDDPEFIPPIPRYVSAIEGPDDPLREKYPLQMIGYHTKRRCHSIHDQNSWLEEVDPPAIWIHPDDAAERGISDGDMVEVFNDRGKVRIPAKVTTRIVRGVTAMSQGGWYKPDKKGTDTRGSINVLTRADTPTHLAKGNPQHTNLVQVSLYRKEG